MSRDPTRIYGHMGELLQGRLGPEGSLALVTLPCPQLWVEAACEDGEFALSHEGEQAISKARVEQVLAALGLPLRGHWHFRLAMPVGAGAGASTATILALARHAAPWASPTRLEALCHGIEGATDPLLRPRAERLLWASRLGKSLAELPPLPPVQVVGGFEGSGVLTEASDLRFPNITPLVEEWQAGSLSPQRLGAIVSHSATESLKMRGGGDPEGLQALASNFGAYGFAIAHTGTARAFLLPPEAPAAPILAAIGKLGWTHLQCFRLGGAKD